MSLYFTFEDALIFTNLELFRQDGLKKMGAITTIANLLKKSTSVTDLQKGYSKNWNIKVAFKKRNLLFLYCIKMTLTIWQFPNI